MTLSGKSWLAIINCIDAVEGPEERTEFSNYSEKEMAALINEVETQFADHLKKAEDEGDTNLAKSEDANVEANAEANVADASELISDKWLPNKR